MEIETSNSTPYYSKLTEPFEPGQTLIIKGKSAEDSVRFAVNFHTYNSETKESDLPLHMSVRFDDGKIVFNTFNKGEWGKEERKSNPYRRGDDIDIRIRAHDGKYVIYIDQKEFKEYEHRIPLSSVTHMSITDDVSITYTHWGGKYYPIPYESGITGDGFSIGKSLIIYGITEKKARRFYLNILNKDGDVAFHFNARFDEKIIVRNSFCNGEWLTDEHDGKLPIERGACFDMVIKNDELAYQIIINGEQFTTYSHRLPPIDLYGLQLDGDIEITGIQMH